jgi:hypothetical protein
VALGLFHVLVTAYSVLVVSIAITLDQTGALSHQIYFAKLGPLYLTVLPVLGCCIALGLIAHRTDDWSERGRMARLYLSSETVGRIAAGLLAVMSFIIFMGSFTSWKNLMPAIQGGFQYDTAQAAIDKILHLGQDPGPALVRLFPYQWLREAVEWNYSVLWSLLGFLPVFFVATHKAADDIRLRYLVTLAGTWILVGSLLALIFLSAGPAFYGSVTGDTARFASIDAFLRESVSLSSAATFQAYLWDNHAAGTSALGSGISAFPSMHVALAMLNALFLREFSRVAGLAGFAYVIVILFSSVYLGWHYAIDGYVSIITVIALYAATRRVLRGKQLALRADPPKFRTIAAPPQA